MGKVKDKDITKKIKNKVLYLFNFYFQAKKELKKSPISWCSRCKIGSHWQIQIFCDMYPFLGFYFEIWRCITKSMLILFNPCNKKCGVEKSWKNWKDYITVTTFCKVFFLLQFLEVNRVFPKFVGMEGERFCQIKLSLSKYWCIFCEEP